MPDPRLSTYLGLAELPDVEYVEQLYRLLLRRDPLPEDRERCVRSLGDGTLSRATLAHELITSPEFARIRSVDDAIAFARNARLRDERPRLLRGPPASDERVVEIAWVLSRYRGERRVLDVGSANADAAYIVALLDLGATDLVAVDLAEAEVPGLRTVAADVRRLPFEDDSFDVAFCVSTLEHVGRDNRAYGLAAEDDPDAPEQALLELKRVLGQSGRLLLTVPCGDPGDADWFLQQQHEQWTRLFKQSDWSVHEAEVYALDDEGWRSTDEAPATGGRYGERGPGASAVLCVELRGSRPLESVRRVARRSMRALRPKR